MIKIKKEMVKIMKIDFENIFKNLNSKSNAIYHDNEKLQKLILNAKHIAEENTTLKKLWSDIKLSLDLSKDWLKGEYKDITKGSIILIIGGLIYLVSPIDLVPDFLPGGFLDDAAVLAYVFKKIGEELIVYKKWKFDKENIIDIFDVEEIDEED